MKFFAILAAVSLAQAAKLDRVYLPPNALASSGSDGLLQTPLQSANRDYDISANTPISNAYGQNTYSDARLANTPSNRNFNQNGAAQHVNSKYAPSGNSGKQYYGANTQQNTYNNDDVSVNAADNSKYGAATNNEQQYYKSNNYNQNDFSNIDVRPERAQAAYERNAAILRQDSSNDGETYSYAYETDNGIYAEENGVATNGVQAQGGYSYTGDDGKVYVVRYTADENGFVPQGDHLPTPPPVPEEILRALEQNAREEAAGIYDDGSYNDAKYAAGSNSNQQYYNGNAQSTNYYDDAVSTNSAGFRNGPLKGNPKYAAASNNDQYYNNAQTAQPIEYNDDTVSMNSAANQNGAVQNVNSKYASANRGQQYYGANPQPISYNDDVVSNADNSKYAAASNNEQQYYKSNAQPINYNQDVDSSNTADFRNAPEYNSIPVGKTYLPPVQKNNQRNSNTRNGYRY